MKLVKLTVSLATCVLALGFLLLGNVGSYVRTATRSLEDSVKEQVPIEFQLRRARDLIEQILPEMQTQIRQIATEEVELATLEKSLADRISRREVDLARLAKIKSDAETKLVSFNGAEVAPSQQHARKLDRVLRSLEHADIAIEADRKMIERRRESLDAALSLLEQTRQQKLSLAQEVESLAARHRLLQSRRIESAKPEVAEQCGPAAELIAQLQRRLSIAERVLDHEAGFEDDEYNNDDLSDADTADIMQRVDEYLARE